MDTEDVKPSLSYISSTVVYESTRGDLYHGTILKSQKKQRPSNL